MDLIRGLHNVRPRHRGAALTIGNFDGVHRGHLAMIRRLKAWAASHGAPAVAVTFEPHPLEFLRPEAAPYRLTGLRDKVRMLAAAGVDAVLCLPFGARLAALEPEAFADRLTGAFAARHLLVGDDFRFGRGRRGDYALLASAGERGGFAVERMETVADATPVDGVQRISSTRIRDLLSQGRFDEAAALLGWRYRVSGRVVRGDGIGRKLGWPTVNLRLPPSPPPLAGIYAGRVYSNSDRRVRGLDGWPAAISVGVRPTVGGRATVFEAYLIDFEGDLYGRHLSVEPEVRLRNEEHFPDLQALTAQIGIDVARAREVLAAEMTISKGR